jgi:hypothetical protein
MQKLLATGATPRLKGVPERRSHQVVTDKNWGRTRKGREDQDCNKVLIFRRGGW